MESILDLIIQEQVWQEFYNDRENSGHLIKRELSALHDFVTEQRYLPIANSLCRGEYVFSVPTLSRISKNGSAKKRIIYQYTADEMWVLKLIGHLLHRYDYCFSDACYSFRQGYHARHAIDRALAIPNLSSLYCLKADIQNYFNSIPVDPLCHMLQEVLQDDPRLYEMLYVLLTADVATDKETGEVIHGSRGAMAGTPISPFLANLYLTDVDTLFMREEISYFRYADDILLFASSLPEIRNAQALLLNQVNDKGLTINPEKFHLSAPGESWEFLGIKYSDGIVDLSDNTKRKIKGKIRRKAHSLYRWRIKKQATYEQAAYVLIRVFNKKFYDLQDTGDFSWSKWFFPLLNTDAGLREIDTYFLQYIRFLQIGHHCKKNYTMRYDRIKELGYRSLVHSYYGSR